MKKLKYIIALAGASVLLTGCLGNVHSHKSDKWEYDQTSHWQTCSVCHQQYNKKAHTIKDDDCTCHTCGYHDPMCVVDKRGILTGLTDYGKNYTGSFSKDDTKKKNDFGKAKLIGAYAFKDSKASEIIIPSNVSGIHQDAFIGVRDKVVAEEEISGETPLQWIKGSDGIYYKENVYENNVAMINGIFYPTLKEAIASVTEDNTIIKITKTDFDIQSEGQIEVNHKIILESHIGTTFLKHFDFLVTPDGAIEVDPSVNFVNGTVNLKAEVSREFCGDKEVSCRNTGSIYFPTFDTAPQDVTIQYTNMGDNPVGAIGCVQGYKAYTQFNVNCLAYGVFKFTQSDNKTIITGLTKFGQTLDKLTITKFINIDGELEMHDDAFNIKEIRDIEITVNGKKKTVKVDGHFQKGIFRTLIINNIKTISNGAFSASFKRGSLSFEDQRAIEKKMSYISSLEFSSDVNIIGNDSFRECCSLITVTLNSNNSVLYKIGDNAFRECVALQSADFSGSINLTEIGKNAFYLCSKLNSVKIARKYGWRQEYFGHTFAAIDLTPQNWAIILSCSYYADHEFKINAGLSQVVYAYHPSDVDPYEIHNKAVYGASVSSLINNQLKDGTIIHVTDEYSPVEEGDITITNGHSVYIINDDLTSQHTVTLGKITVENDAFIVLGPNIKVTGPVTLNITNPDPKKMGGKVGGIAFGYSSQEMPYPTIKIGDNIAEGAKTKIGIENKNMECTSFGLAYFKNDTYKYLFDNLSHLGNQCKDLELKKQHINMNLDGIYINDGFSNNNNVIENLTLDDQIYVSGDSMFMGCANLETVKIGAKFKHIKDKCFNDCAKLKSVDMRANTELYGLNGFKNCKSLTSVVIGDNNTKFKYKYRGAFEHAPITSFKMPSGLTSGWRTASGQSFSSDDIGNPEKCAQLIREYCEVQWERN